MNPPPVAHHNTHNRVTMNVVLTSTSKLKSGAINDVFVSQFSNQRLFFNSASIKRYSTEEAEIPPEPVNSGQKCSELRIDFIKDNNKLKAYDVIISIENGLVVNNSEDHSSVTDVCYVTLETDTGYRIRGQSKPCFLPAKFYYEAKNRTPDDYKLLDMGLIITVGEIIHEEYPDINPKNWMVDSRFGNKDRRIQINEALLHVVFEYKTWLLNKKILRFDNFPKKGVMFKDLSAIMADPKDFRILIKLMVAAILRVDNDDLANITKIIGLDSRGFIFGPLLANELKVGFVMARKAGKLPGPTHGINYSTEYSNASIEVMQGVIEPEDKILVVDDLVATGGSLWAAAELVKKCGGTVVGCFTILKVDPLFDQAQKKLGDVPIYTLINHQ